VISPDQILGELADADSFSNAPLKNPHVRGCDADKPSVGFPICSAGGETFDGSFSVELFQQVQVVR
jgi:hypothetical protein